MDYILILKCSKNAKLFARKTNFITKTQEKLDCNDYT